MSPFLALFVFLKAQFCKLTITNPFGTVHFFDTSQLLLAVGLNISQLAPFKLKLKHSQNLTFMVSSDDIKSAQD